VSAKLSDEKVQGGGQLEIEATDPPVSRGGENPRRQERASEGTNDGGAQLASGAGHPSEQRGPRASRQQRLGDTEWHSGLPQAAIQCCDDLGTDEPAVNASKQAAFTAHQPGTAGDMAV
jgi:hypothetical protein